MKRIGIILLMLIASSCEQRQTKNQAELNTQKEVKELIMETEHCRYYCLARDGYGNCKMVICECDSGYNADVSLTW